MKPLAIELAFDADSDRCLNQAWSHLSTLYAGTPGSELGVRPHITLALFRDGEPCDLSAVAESLAGQQRPFGLRLASVDHFPGSEGVVFLRPDASDALARAHDKVQELLGEDRNLVDAYYRPEVWQPHCTMAVNVPQERLEAVLSACRCSEARGDVRVDRVQVVRYRPPTEMFEAALEGGRSN